VYISGAPTHGYPVICLISLTTIKMLSPTRYLDKWCTLSSLLVPANAALSKDRPLSTSQKLCTRLTQHQHGMPPLRKPKTSCPNSPQTRRLESCLVLTGSLDRPASDRSGASRDATPLASVNVSDGPTQQTVQRNSTQAIPILPKL
jgi:hypothetical protein